ncbi:MAG: ABC transporter substrate-binding protein, partial [Acetobacteraceae bacterium]
MSQDQDRIRFGCSEIQNHLIDEWRAGRLSRRGFLARASATGMSLPAIAALLGVMRQPACAAAKPGGTIRVAQTTPAGAVDPVTVADLGGLVLLQQTGEFLIYDAPDLSLRPMLATSWKPNLSSDVWTFTLRRGVKFHSGSQLGADDVVATMDRLANPKNGSNARSVFKGVLSPGGTKKIDDHTVAFHLERPVGHFPYYVSTDNYNAIILPAAYKGDFEKTFDGSGPFRLDKYTPKVGASFVRNPGWWGGSVLPDRTEFGFYADQQSQVLAMQGQQVDVMQQLTVQGGQGLLNNPDVKLIKLRSSAHREVHMRCDTGPFTDKRVRQAMALTLDRPALIAGLFHGLSDLGNDSPFAPVFPSTNLSVAQRKKDIAHAKSLLAAAGKGSGFVVTLTTEQLQEIPDYAVLIRNAAAQIGITVNLKVEDQSAYYGAAEFGKSDWLDSPLGITDYGHRGVPDALLAAALTSNGAWNAAHFKNPTYDKLVADSVATPDLQSQRAIAGKIETLLLDETPIIFAYFYNYLIATGAGVSGVTGTA